MKLYTKILLGLVVGAAAGSAARAPGAPWVHALGEYIAGPIGQIFLRMLLMRVVPLVFVSVALGVASLGDVRKLGRVGGKTLGYFLLSTALSAAIGLTLVNWLDPGAGLDPGVRAALFETYSSQVGVMAGAPTADDARFEARPAPSTTPASARSPSSRPGPG